MNRQKKNRINLQINKHIYEIREKLVILDTI